MLFMLGKYWRFRRFAIKGFVAAGLVRFRTGKWLDI
jgi:hypothetical protein